MRDENRVLTVPFAVLFLATFALFCAIGIVQPVTPRLVQNGLGGNDRDVGLMSTAYAVAAVGCRPLLSLVGRRGPRALMILGSLVSLVGFAAHLRVESLTVLATGRAIAAVGEAMIWVGYGTYVSALAPPGRQAEAISLSTVAVFGGIGVGPVIGDPLARAGRFDLAVLIAWGCVLVCALTLQRAPDPAERAAVLGSFSMFFEVGVGAGGLFLGALADRSGERAAFGLGGLVTAAGLVLLTSVLRHPVHRSSTAPT